MTDDGVITNKILLEHIQGLRGEMVQRFDTLEKRVDRLAQEVKQGFKQARDDREAIREDLDATIRMQALHDKKIAVLAGDPLPEDY